MCDRERFELGEEEEDNGCSQREVDFGPEIEGGLDIVLVFSPEQRIVPWRLARYILNLDDKLQFNRTYISPTLNTCR